MDIINDLIEQNGGALLSTLTGQAGYSADQAETFLPEAGRSVAAAMTSKASDLDFSDVASAANVGTVLESIDVANLATRTGVTAEQGNKGLSAILPMLLGFMGERGDAGTLLGLFGKAEGLGDALEGLKGLGGKLFG